MEEAAQRLPELRRARIYQAAALARVGRTDEAAELYIEATASRPEPVMAEAWILPAFADRAARTPSDPWSHYWHGVVLTHYGLFDRAVEALRTAFSLDGRPEFADAILDAEHGRVVGR
jgi:tetratricopeptide (TPR) repeat protein